MLRCQDNSIYTGITTDLNRRMEEHFAKTKKSAKYTRYHIPQKLECAWSSSSRALASKLEYHIKRLPKDEKEKLIESPERLKEIIKNKIEDLAYKKVH